MPPKEFLVAMLRRPSSQVNPWKMVRLPRCLRQSRQWLGDWRLPLLSPTSCRWFAWKWLGERMVPSSRLRMIEYFYISGRQCWRWCPRNSLEGFANCLAAGNLISPAICIEFWWWVSSMEEGFGSIRREIPRLRACKSGKHTWVTKWRNFRVAEQTLGRYFRLPHRLPGAHLLLFPRQWRRWKRWLDF